MKISFHPDFQKSWDRLFHWKYAPLRWWEFISRDMWMEIKWFIQRGRRGWADNDVWALNDYLSGWLPDAIEHLKKNKHGCPAEYFDNDAPDGKHCKRFDDEVLDVIIDGMKAANLISNCETPQQVEALQSRFERGMDALKKGWWGLWD